MPEVVRLVGLSSSLLCFAWIEFDGMVVSLYFLTFCPSWYVYMLDLQNMDNSPKLMEIVSSKSYFFVWYCFSMNFM